MKRTLILYQWPLALPDVYRWAADNKFVLGALVPEDKAPSYIVRRAEETIIIKATDDIDHLADQKPDKLVLWGAFSKEQLTKIIEVM